MRGYWDDRGNHRGIRRGMLAYQRRGPVRPAENLVMAGRSREMYIRGGYNVYPLEVEHVLAEHPRWPGSPSSACRPR